MPYEFNDEEAEKVWVFGNITAITSLILGLGGIVGLITQFFSLGGEDAGRAWVLMFEFLFMIIMAMILYRPSDNFKLIATSEGRDVEELMQGMKDFTLAWTITAGMMIFIGLLNFFLIMGKVG